MHLQALLDLTIALIERIQPLKQPADQIVSDFFHEHRALGSRERHILAETVYHLLRMRPMITHLAETGSGPKPRRLALLAWQGSTDALRTAVTPSERTWLDQTDKVDRAGLPEPLRHNLPLWLAEPLQARLGDEFWTLVNAMNQSAPLDLRVNVMKSSTGQVRAALKEAGILARTTRWAPTALRVDGKPALTRLEVFQRGDVEVQDEGSQLLALLVDAKRGEMVVDFCAGAGGKTLALGAAMRNTGRLYALDISGHRLAALKPRLARSGLSNVYPIQIAHERDDRIKRLAGKIDRVLVDAPCSGLGTLRRNPDLKWRQSLRAVQEMQVKQIDILASAARLLKSGGRLVYATCSLLEAENEAVVAAFEASHADFERLPVAPLLAKLGVAEADQLAEDGFLRLWPHRHETDGFFASVWQRV